MGGNRGETLLVFPIPGLQRYPPNFPGRKRGGFSGFPCAPVSTVTLWALSLPILNIPGIGAGPFRKKRQHEGRTYERPRLFVRTDAGATRLVLLGLFYSAGDPTWASG